MSISVVIPTFNRRQYLERSVGSVVRQSLAADEIIVVDDGSSDDTVSWLSQNYPHVTIIEQANQGVSAARNRGIQAAKGDWIALLDSDDAWLPDKLLKQRAALEAKPEYLFCHAEDIWYRKEVRVNAPKHYAKPKDWCFEACLPRCVISPSSAIIHRKVYKHVGLFDERLPACEDYDLWLRITTHYPLLFVQEALSVKYDGHEGQLSDQRGLDFYRIQALAKLLKTGQITQQQREATLRVFEKKCSVYLKGARKHGNLEGASHVEQLLAQAS